MSKMFTVAGTSVLEGILKFRVANGGAAARAKVLEKNGHTQINLQDLPKAMTKEDAMAFLKYVEGKPVKAEAPKAAPTKAEKPKAAPKAEKVVEKEFKVENKAPVEAPKAEKTPEEIAAVRAKNKETMRKVSTARREAERKAKRDELMEPIEAAMEEITKDDIPQFLWKECGIKATDTDDFNYVGSKHHY